MRMIRLARILTVLLSTVFPILTSASDLALVGGKIYPSPAEPPIENGVVLVRDGRIAALGPRDKIQVPTGALTLDCKGMTIAAGLWNSHVHILTPGLLHAEKSSAHQISSQLQQMLTRWGFTTVFDLASVLANTNVIRTRIKDGEVLGPRIFTVGEPFYGKGGTPVYIKPFLEANHISLPEVQSTAQAIERVRQQVRDGADGIKIFTGSIEANGVLVMPLDLATKIVSEAHRLHRRVFAHPSNPEGTEVAIQSGVDVLAHTAPAGGGWKPELVRRMKERGMALIPTLTLFDVEAKKAHVSAEENAMWIRLAVEELKAYADAGGQILFGTDVGYTEHFDTAEEFTLMARAGLDFRHILASLTTNPAERFGYAQTSGRIAKGFDGDLVVLNNDPAKNVTAFSNVRYTIRGGKVIYDSRAQQQ